MKYLKLFAVFFFELIDTYLHKKRILNYLKKNGFTVKIFFDVGSHKGTYTDLFLKNYKISKAYIFEPQKNIFEFLKNKYKKNNKIFISNNAISDQNTFRKLFINRHDVTSSLTILDSNNLYLRIKSILFGGKSMIINSYHVKTIKLKNFIEKNKIKKIDLIKIDTEGHEFQVLKGLEKKISIIKIILVEFHNDIIYKNYSNKKVQNYLKKNNFGLKKIIKFPFTQWEDRIYIKR